MNAHRTAKRVKTLETDPIGDNLIKFRLTLDDTTHTAEGAEVIHSLAIEGELSLPELEIRAIEPYAYHQPYPQCAASLAPVRLLVGSRIGPGFRKRVLELMGRTRGCTHFLSLTLDLAAAHTLSTFLRMRRRAAFNPRGTQSDVWMRAGLEMEPGLENACIALQTASPVILRARGDVKT